MISIVIPVRDELESVAAQVREALEAGLPGELEVVVVDDGSTDGTSEALDKLARLDGRVVAVHLGSPQGKSAAYNAGFARARGDVVVTMDGDLQDDARDVPKLLARLGEGFDAAIGWRRRRCHPLLSKRVPSFAFNLFVRALFGLPLHDANCPLRAVRAERLRGLELAPGEHRLLPVILALRGARVAEVPVSHRPRLYGRPKYGSPGRFLEGLSCLARLWREGRAVAAGGAGDGGGGAGGAGCGGGDAGSGRSGGAGGGADREAGGGGGDG